MPQPSNRAVATTQPKIYFVVHTAHEIVQCLLMQHEYQDLNMTCTCRTRQLKDLLIVPEGQDAMPGLYKQYLLIDHEDQDSNNELHMWDMTPVVSADSS